jgi:putative transposase
MPWKKLLVWATGQINDALRQKLEFVLEENRVYRALLDRHSPRWRLQDAERKGLAQKGKPLGQLLHEVITIVQPETLLKWHRQRVASKWDFSRRRKAKPGRPSVSVEIEKLALQFARQNSGWGYDRIVGALANLGHRISDQTVGNILQRQGLGPAPERKRNTTWAEFIRRHKEVLWATDFFTAEVWTCSGLTTFYILFFLHLQTRRVILGGLTPFPKTAWLKQVARNLTARGRAHGQSPLPAPRP